MIPISVKANRTNIFIKSNSFHSSGVAISSIDQYKGVFNIVENFSPTGNKICDPRYAAYTKTCTGDQVGYPPNGDGGGLGCRYRRTLVSLSFSLKNHC